MLRRAAWFTLCMAGLLGAILFLSKMGLPGWFTLSFFLVLFGVTVVFFWGFLVAAGVAALATWLIMRRVKRDMRELEKRP